MEGQYLNPVIFFQKYPIGEELSRGSYGIVYASGSKHVVKYFMEENSVLELAKEVNYYSSYLHPCILKPVAWTVKNQRGFLAMPRGEDIVLALKTRNITIEELISDTLSAAVFLNSQGIAFCDYKPGNIVYHNRRAKLIDFGLARKATLGPGGQYYITGIAYSSPCIDPEYSSEQQNNINCEIYSLVMTYITLIDEPCVRFGVLTSLEYRHSGIQWLVEQASLFQEDRRNISELLDKAPNSLIKRRYFALPFKQPEIPENKNNDVFYDDMQWVVQTTYLNNFRAETLFLMLHLLHRVYHPLLEEYSVKTELETKRYLILAAVITLAGFMLGDRVIYSSTWEKQYIFAKEKNIEEKHIETMADILRITNGILITLTYWDYAKSKEDLLPLLKDTIACYNPIKIRIVNPGSNKDVGVREMLSAIELVKLKTITITGQPMEEDPTLQPCQFIVEGDVSIVEKGWKIEKPDIKIDKSLITMILYNRKKLYLLELKTALKIYETFLESSESFSEYVLDIICLIPWRNYLQDAITQRVHPFRKQVS